jgi:hypothetical protein
LGLEPSALDAAGAAQHAIWPTNRLLREAALLRLSALASPLRCLELDADQPGKARPSQAPPPAGRD